MPGSSSKCIILILLFAFAIALPAISQSSDLKLIQKQSFKKPEYEKQGVRPFLKPNSNHVLAKYNPVRLAFGGMLYFYQNVISRQYSAQCMYNPSCSSYGKQLIYEYGLIPGIFYTADRIMRCNRLAETDLEEYQVDPADHRVHESLDRYRRKK